MPIPEYAPATFVRPVMRAALLSVVLLTVLLPAAGRAAEPEGCARPYGDGTREIEVVELDARVPFGGGVELSTRALFPRGSGRVPVAILNHGSPRDPKERAGRAIFEHPARWFLSQGFAVVVPNRRGYGGSGGGYAEGFGSCERPDYVRAGLASARDIDAVVRWVRAQEWAHPRRIVVVGQSAGGFGALALASRNPAGVAAIVSFAAGRGSAAPEHNCAPQELVRSAAVYGRTARIPSLWVYTENDREFGPGLAQALFAAYGRSTRSRAALLVLPPFGADGHGIFGARGGGDVWGPDVARFLRIVGGIYCD